MLKAFVAARVGVGHFAVVEALAVIGQPFHALLLGWGADAACRNLVGSVIPFLRIHDFVKEFSSKADEMLADFEQHQKDVKALQLLEQQANNFKQNINLINDMRRVILHRYIK